MKPIFSDFLVPLFIVGFSSICPAQTTLILRPDGASGKDALLHGLQSQANSNFGSSPELPASAWSFSNVDGTLRSVLEFDFSSLPANAVIIHANLSLFAIDNTNGQGQHSTLSGSNACWLERVTSPWDESAVTWNNQPATSLVNRVEIPESSSPTQDFSDLDVTNLVNDMFSNMPNNYGFMLKLQDETKFRRMNFCSSDHTNPLLRPELAITYLVPSQIDTCIVLQPDAASGKDALLHGLPSEQNNSYGASPELPAAAWTFSNIDGLLRSVIEFDLSSVPPNTFITSALLSLYSIDNANGQGYHSALSGSNACWLERVTSPWDESTVTWNNQPSTTPANRVELLESLNQTQDYTGMNVTQLVTDMADDPSNSHGFMLKLENEIKFRRMNFCSSDHTTPSLRPRLEICYSFPNSSENGMRSNQGLLIFPNPGRGILNVVTGNHIKSTPRTVSVYNFSGAEILTFTTVRNFETLDISQYPAGVYFLKISSDSSMEMKKFVVQ